jgi:Zn-dependent protease with chaperone function
MIDEQFKALVERLDAYARIAPDAYKQRVRLLAFAGYAYLFAMLGVLLASFVALGYLVLAHDVYGALAAKLGFVLVVLIWSILSSLSVRVGSPQGVAIEEPNAPKLFAVIDDLRQRLRSPKLHRVLLTDDFNMGVAQVPRLGLFAGYRNYLVVGMPMLSALDVEQCRAVLAHEFGHLSGSHGKFGTWIYRIRTTWMQLLKRLHDGRHWGSFLFTWFFDRYAPYFFAYTYVLARTVEYEADRRAAEVSSPAIMAGALIACELRGRVINEKFWPGFLERHNRDEHAPSTAFMELAEVARGPLPIDSRQWLAAALERPAEIADSHPSLGQRVAALGFSDSTARELWSDGVIEQSAADDFFEDRVGGFREQLGLHMQSVLEPEWQQRVQRREEGRRSMVELDSLRVERPLNPSELWTYAIAKADNDGDDAAIPAMEAVIAADPEHPDANLWLGQVLAEKGDEAGIAFLETASSSNSVRAFHAADTASRFYAPRDPQKSEMYRRRADDAANALRAAYQQH